MEQADDPPAASDAPSNLFADWDRTSLALGLLYLASSYSTAYTFSYILLYWADVSAVVHLPLAGFFCAALLSGLATLLAHFTRFKSDWLGAPSVSPLMVKHSLAAGSLGALLRASLAVATQRLPFVISEALHLLAAPALLLFLPALGLPSPATVQAYAILALTVAFGFALYTAQVSALGAAFASATFLLHALLCAFLKRWRMQSGLSPGSILTAYSSVATLVSLIVFSVGNAIAPANLALDELLPNPTAFCAFALSATVEHFTLVHLACRVDSPITIVALSLPKIVMAFVVNPAEWGRLTQFPLINMAVLLSCGLLAQHLWDHLRDSKKRAYLPVEGSPSPRWSKSRHISPLVVLLSFLPYTMWSVRELSFHKYLASPPAAVQAHKTLDIIISYYNEPLDELKEQLEYIRSLDNIMHRKPAVLAYVKGPNVSIEAFKRETGIEEVYVLPNKGREGDTYLHHIMRNYNATLAPADPWQAQKPRRLDENGGLVEPRGLADQNLFLQNHLSWNWVAKPRMKLFSNQTGFLAFAPYLKMDCGHDSLGNGEFAQAAQIYTLIEEEFCPPTMQLASYAGQFAASKWRIMKRPLEKYQYLDDILTADASHWVHAAGEGFAYREQGKSDAANPFLGHSLERSWAVIMSCNDPKIADDCDDNTFDEEKCQCWDFRDGQ